MNNGLRLLIGISLLAFLVVSGCQRQTTPETLEKTTAPAVTNTPMPAFTPTPAEQPTSEPDPTPKAIPEPSPTAIQVPTSEDLIGVWLGTVAGERGYLLFTGDGRYEVALSQENLGQAPRVAGEYWVETGQLHLRDLYNAGHWAVCDADQVGVYDLVAHEDGTFSFLTIDEPCSSGGFTRSYIFTNMVQEWVSEPVAAFEIQPLPELAAALQSIADTWVEENGMPAFILMVDAPDLNFTWKGAAGLADPEAGMAAVAGDQFIISSGTKPYTAALIMLLAEQGKLDIDAPITTYLPADLVSELLVIDGQSYGEAITVRQLMQHTSGLGDFSNGEDLDENGRPDFKDLVLSEPDTLWNEAAVLEWAIANAPPVARPGEMFHYSDTNYQLLGMVIEETSGQTLHEAYRQMIFEPVGMTHTYFEFREPAVAGVDGRPVSSAYYSGTLWNELNSHSYEWGSGGLVSTVEDQNRFLWALVNSELFDDPASWSEMTTWQETENCGAYYGLGLWQIVYEECDIPGIGTNIGHAGLFNSHAHYWPEQNITIIGTMNSSEPSLGFFGVIIEVMYTVQEFTSG